MKKILMILSLWLFFGCSDNSISTVHNKKILENKIEYMNLVVFPPKESIEKKLNELYAFNKECELKLIVSYKDSITCNSNQNSDKKVLGMPNSYLRFELKKQRELFYSYYIDLSDNIKSSDVENGFNTMEDTLPIRAK